MITLVVVLICIQVMILLTQFGCMVHDMRYGGQALGGFAFWGVVPNILIMIVVLGLPT